MALTDLITETSSPKFSLDEPTEIKCMEMVLRLMEDSNGEVKNAGIKAYVPPPSYLAHTNTS
jgi:hypothetical protein